MDHEQPYLSVTIDEPFLPSDVAVIVTVPSVDVIGVRETRPELTVARKMLLDDQFIDRPVSVFPAASLSVAVSWIEFWPAARVAGDGVTVTLATGGAVTVTVADPDIAANVAEMLTGPAETPVTSPLALTVALAVAADAQVNGTPAIALFDPSRAVAVSWRV
jgi:hypothetical protein